MSSKRFHRNRWIAYSQVHPIGNWGLRDYGEDTATIWDGDPACEHEWGVSKIELDKTGKVAGGGWERPSRTEYAKSGNHKKCPVCGTEFKAKIGQKFCSHECLNTLSNEQRTNTQAQHSFCIKCGAWRGQLGLEPTFELYLKHLCDIFDEVKRVLKKTGTCWVVIGDTYSGSWGAMSHDLNGKAKRQGTNERPPSSFKQSILDKSLCNIPARFSIEMVNRGWILRNRIEWHKPNCMPSSAKDRFTVDYEDIYFFVKSNDTQYWTNNKTGAVVDKQPLGTKGVEGIDWDWEEDETTDPPTRKKVSHWSGHDYWFEQQFEEWTDTNPHDTKRAGKYIAYGGKHTNSKDNKGIVVGDPQQGRNKRCVWRIPTQPYAEAHFAVFPPDLCVTPIQAGCPQYICKKCGLAREKMYVDTGEYDKQGWSAHSKTADHVGVSPTSSIRTKQVKIKRNEGYTDCGCGAGWRPGVVLDPFAGSGTALMVARQLGRDFIGIEINPKYITMTQKRLMAVPESLFR